jgi:autotransporter-associated beta strand protein
MLIGASVRTVEATHTTWNNSGPGQNWCNTSNWVEGSLPGTTDTAIFNFSTYAHQPNVASNNGTGVSNAYTIQIGSLSAALTMTFYNTTTNYCSNLNVYAGGIDMSAATNDLTMQYDGGTKCGTATHYVMQAAQPWTIASGRTLTVVGSPNVATVDNGGFLLTVNGAGNVAFNGLLQGAGGLTMNGTGTLNLSYSNTYTGLTTISAGTLKLGAAGGATNTPLGTTTNGTVVSSVGTLDMNGYSLGTIEALTLGGTGTSGSGALTNSSSTAATWQGLITLSADASIVANSGNIVISNTGSITGNTYDLTLDGTATACTFASVIATTTGMLVKNGAGAWTISGNSSTYSGGTTINAGTLSVTNTVGSGTGSGAVTVNSGGTLAGTGIINGAMTINAGGTLSPGVGAASGTLTVGNYNITMTSGAMFSVILNGNGNNDVLSWGGTSTSCNLGSATLQLTLGGGYAPVNGNTNTIINSASITATGTFNGLPSGAYIGVSNGTTTYYFTISYTGGASTHCVVLTCTSTPPNSWKGTTSALWSAAGTGNWSGGKPASGTTIAYNYQNPQQNLATGNNDITGPTLTNMTINFVNPQGDVTIVNSQTLGLGAGGINMSNASKNFTIQTPLSLGAAQPWIVSGGYTLTTTTTASITDNNNVLTIDGAGTTIINGVMGSGSGGIKKIGTGTLTLSGSNTYTGVTTISNGTLKLGANGGGTNTPLGTTTNGTVVNSGGTLDLAGFTLGTSEALTLNGTGVSNSGALMNSGSAATWSGLITLGSSGVSIVGGTGTIAISNVGNITGSGYNLTLGGAQGGSVTSNINTGSGTLTKADAGTWTLSGTNSSYTGATAINAGTLNVTGSLASGSAVTVASGATLAGNGTVSGTVNVLNGGIVAPGNGGPGTLNTGALTLNSTSVLNYDVGTSTDLIAVTGALTLDGTLNITANGTYALGTYNIITYSPPIGNLTNNGLAVGTTPAGNYSYLIDISTAGYVKLVISNSKWSQTGLGTISGGAVGGSALYVGAGSTLYSRNLSNGSNNWATPFSSGHGAVHKPTCAYIGSSYQTFAAETNYFLGVQDNGSAYGTISGWPGTEISLTGAGTPYVSASGTYLYVPCSNGNLTLISMSNGSVYKTQAVTLLDTSVDMVSRQDYLYVASTNGNINRLDQADGTAVTTYALPSAVQVISLPLLMSGDENSLYVTPAANNMIVALNVSGATLTTKWSPTTFSYTNAANNTGAAYTNKSSNAIYTAAGNYVYKITDNGGGTAPTQTWCFTASAKVNSGPIWYTTTGTTVYFGCSNGSYYAINDANWTALSGWPKATDNNDASLGPWIDPTNNEVIFGTTGGHLDAYTLVP